MSDIAIYRQTRNEDAHRQPEVVRSIFTPVASMNFSAVSPPAPQMTFHKGSDAVIYIWLSNHTDTRKTYAACCEATFLQIFDVFDSSGRVLETAVDARLRNLGRKSDRSIAACSCSALRMVEPGTCRVVDQGTLNRKDLAYSLTPGHYTIRERHQLEGDQGTPTADGLTINIDEH